MTTDPKAAHEDERTVRITGVRDWTRLHTEIAPAFRRDFPGVIVEIDERIVYSTIPDPEWRGAAITIIGIEQRTADSIVGAFAREVVHDRRSTKRVTSAEAKRLDEHRATLRHGTRQAAHV